jgi:hypothetical protein
MRTLEQRYLAALRKLSGRVNRLEQAARWKQELEHRIWKAGISINVLGSTMADLEALEAEVAEYKAVMEAIKQGDD